MIQISERWNQMKSFGIAVLWSFTLTLAFSGSSWANSCYVMLNDYRYALLKGGNQPFVLTAAGTKVPLSRAFEKEGLWYADIESWFPEVDPLKFEKRLRDRLAAEVAGKKPRKLIPFLTQFHEKYRAVEYYRGKPRRPALSHEEILNELAVGYVDGATNPFYKINGAGKDYLFYEGILEYEDLLTTPNYTPRFMAVGTDLGSYEVKSVKGVTDHRSFEQQRDMVEDQLEGSIGHQHIAHAWPEDPQARRFIAPYYIELLDSTTWFLFWRQMSRDPDEAQSVLGHPYLGVYTRPALDRLYDAIQSGDVKRFKNKFRMVGARVLPGDPNVPEQAGKLLPDWELRSGNKSAKRAFVESMVISRISSGDYSGIRDFRSYSFNPSSEIGELVSPALARDIRAFEAVYPYLKYSPDPRSHNHFRNKVIAPLLAWEQRLPGFRAVEELKAAQLRYAEGVAAVGRDYIKKLKRASSPNEIGDLRQETLSQLEDLIYRFEKSVNLAGHFERYLKPLPAETDVGSILVKSSGPLDVNQVNLGIEYSFRFSDRVSSAEQAEAEIRAAGQQLQAAFGGGSFEKLSDGGHGHGLSIRYRYTDPQGKVWRVEWDGVKRSYRVSDKDGKAAPYWRRGGHIEVPSPKFAPQDMKDVRNLYAAMRATGKSPKRSAGGAHVNIDLAPLFSLAEEEGVRKLINLILYVEANRPMMTFLWQHPFRMHSAIPLELSAETILKLQEFRGDWKDFAVFLYDRRYLNSFVDRKPGYVQLNLVGMMAEHVDAGYRESIDIKNPQGQWFPAFGGKSSDRAEFRMFDAMPDEAMAALQIKYVRALLDKTWNAESGLQFQKRFDQGHVELWKRFPEQYIRDAEDHFRDLGLDPVEFRPLIVSSFEQQFAEPKKDWKAGKVYPNFKRAKPTGPKK